MKVEEIKITKLVAATGKKLHRKGTNDCYSEVFPSKLDSIDNYEEVTEEQAKEYEQLKAQEDEALDD